MLIAHENASRHGVQQHSCRLAMLNSVTHECGEKGIWNETCEAITT
jgi:hypothetical protein